MPTAGLADLCRDDRHLLQDADESRVPARLVLTIESVAIAVPAGRELVERIDRLVLQPSIELRTVVVARHDDDVGGASAANDGHQLLHARRAERHASADAA